MSLRWAAINQGADDGKEEKDPAYLSDYDQGTLQLHGNNQTFSFRRRALFALPFLIVLMIIAIELTLAFNSISGVYEIKSTGQLIPFIIGVCGLWSTINDLSFTK